MLSDVGGGGSKFSGRPILIFFIKENWICAITRHHAESNINLLLTRTRLWCQTVKPYFIDTTALFGG